MKRCCPLPGTRAVILLGFAVAILGCASGAPIISGEAQEPLVPSSRALSGQEVQDLRAWLREHRSGWMPLLSTPPPASFVLVIQQANGRVSHLEFFSEDEWRNAVVWGEGDARAYVARLPGDGVAAIHAALQGDAARVPR